MSGQQGQASGADIQAAAAKFQQPSFNPYGNVNNQIVDARQPVGGLLAGPGKFTQAQQQFPIGNAAQLPMGAPDPGLDATMQGLLGLQQQAKQNKQAILKAFMGG